MESAHDLCIIGLGGSELLKIPDVLFRQTTGRDIKEQVAQTLGLTLRYMSLLLSTGMDLNDALLAETLQHVNVVDSSLTVTCVLAPVEPFGLKAGTDPHFGTKSGTALRRRIRQEEVLAPHSVSNNRTPDPKMYEAVFELLTSSFAGHLKPLIKCALDAAYNYKCDTTARNYMYEDAVHGASADLASCRLLTRVFHGDPSAARGDGWNAPLGETLVGAVLWRLLFGWQHAAASATGDQGDAGPILEVLFLGIAVGLREGG